jgi:AcrR family transcriptional regulator
VVRTADARRDALLDAAARVFREKGLAAATVADVARTAGMAKGSVYQSFSSKEELLAALKSRCLQDLADRAEEVSRRLGSDDLWSLCDEFVELVVDFDLEHRDLLALFAQQPMGPEREPRDGERRVHELLTVGIKVGMAARTFDVDDPSLTAWMLMDAIQGTTLRLLQRDAPFDRDRLVEAARALVRRALSPGVPANP